MNQTKKRLQIINIAISITDIETIQLQMLKLASLRSDSKLKEILSGLQARNYAQTQALITAYINTPTEEIIQRSSPQEEQALIEEFDLFVETPQEKEQEESTLFDFDTLTQEVAHTDKQTPPSPQTHSADFDNLLNLTAKEVMPDNIALNSNSLPKDDFFAIDTKEEMLSKESHIDTNLIPKDDFFDTIKTDYPEEEETPLEETLFEREEALPSQENLEDTQHISETMTTFDYQTIPYIDQKLKNMLIQYPPVEEAEQTYLTVNNWLLKISKEGYDEQEVEEVIAHVGRLKEKNALAEAAQLLLICGATESLYAHFMLARELFRGEILIKNLPEAFTLIHRLAMDDDYPEAICDLAQFYEKGVGIDKDKKRAQILYKEAMEAGVKRATSHYERLTRENRGLLGKLFGKK